MSSLPVRTVGKVSQGIIRPWVPPPIVHRPPDHPIISTISQPKETCATESTAALKPPRCLPSLVLPATHAALPHAATFLFPTRLPAHLRRRGLVSSADSVPASVARRPSTSHRWSAPTPSPTSGAPTARVPPAASRLPRPPPPRAGPSASLLHGALVLSLWSHLSPLSSLARPLASLASGPLASRARLVQVHLTITLSLAQSVDSAVCAR